MLAGYLLSVFPFRAVCRALKTILLAPTYGGYKEGAQLGTTEVGYVDVDQVADEELGALQSRVSGSFQVQVVGNIVISNKPWDIYQSGGGQEGVIRPWTVVATGPGYRAWDLVISIRSA